jgi:sporulation protein YlmC with PRC-barrel domain
MTAAFAAMMALSMPMALAQTTPSPSARPSTDNPTATHETATRAGGMTHMMPDQIRVTDMDGATVYDTKNHNIGDVKDILLNKDGRVDAVVLDVGSFLGMGGKMVAIPMSDLKVSSEKNMNNNNSSSSNKPRFTVNMTKEQLKSAQAFEFNPNNAKSGSSTPPANNMPPRSK